MLAWCLLTFLGAWLNTIYERLTYHYHKWANANQLSSEQACTRPEASLWPLLKYGSNLLEFRQNPRLGVATLQTIFSFLSTLWNSDIVNKRGVHNNTRINLLLLLSFTFPHIQVENLTFGGGKELQRKAEHAANQKRLLIHAGVGWNQMTNQAVAVAVRQWLRHDSMWQRNYLQKQKPHSKFFILDINMTWY